ncbi:hypothetical protein Ahia01_000706000 [Argonauta hians]
MAEETASDVKQSLTLTGSNDDQETPSFGRNAITPPASRKSVPDTEKHRRASAMLCYTSPMMLTAPQTAEGLKFESHAETEETKDASCND